MVQLCRSADNLHKRLYILLLCANILTLLLCTVYLATAPLHVWWNALGVLLLLTLLGNIVAAITPSPHSWIDYLYLLATAGFFVAIPLLNRAASINISHLSSRSTLTVVLLFSLLFLGLIVTFMKLHKRASYSEKAIPDSLTVKGITILLTITIFIGVYASVHLIIGKSAGIIEMTFPQYAVFFSLVYLALTGLLLKMHRNRKSSFFYKSVLIGGVWSASVFLIPLAVTPFWLVDAEETYTQSFEITSEPLISLEAKSQTMMNIPFSLPDYFFGKRSGEYRVIENIPYYEGTTGPDKGIKLKFDAYLPPEGKTDLPGKQSVLIRIHGGGWTAGDKGSSNNPQVNKYFASQGFVVFDVQYGLSHEEKLFSFSQVPENIVAGFSIDDMVRHIGIFTDYLAKHHQEYGANLNSVFVSGASAGGQLANAAGLGANGVHDFINPSLHVKGIISVYPANGLAPYLEIEGTKELTDPARLISEKSPPALVFQGTHDGLVPPFVAQAFDQTYKQYNLQSALLLAPFGGHACVSYFPGYYNQTFLYYMERFLYQFQ
ncbi:alpha/beta hydrolase [Bacillus sp. FJAT-44742]|uniref:alpha/beta hydrolase n=1 Tax=Bacillus sp. FJAT-44742 TaxID=2014005 RepID=UPI000C242CAD|nr:alpha/beta hydrolase [Bacillus sp. FJAT-44742]